MLLPCYSQLRSKLKKCNEIARFFISKKEIVIIEANLPGNRLKCWLLDYPAYFDRSGTPSIIRCHKNYLNKEIWIKLQRNAMRQDFSWQNSAKQYIELYSMLIQKTKKPLYALQ